jgi:hypothetical protein
MFRGGEEVISVSSWIYNEKPIVLNEKTAIPLKSQRPLPRASRCRSSRLTRWWARKIIIGKRGLRRRRT